MGTKKQAFILLISAMIMGCSAAPSFTKEGDDFKKYATSICIGSSFNSDEVKSDANSSANSYMGNISLDSYEELRDTLKTWGKDSFNNKSGSRVDIMRCLEFSESEEVQLIFNKYNPCLNSASWIDKSEFHKQCK
jgi:hypothetical protein